MSRNKNIEQMLRAASSGDVSAVRMALDSGVDADAEDRHGNRAINNAAKAGNIEIVKLLIQRGANINQADGIGRTPLIACAESDNVEMANLLLSAGADVNGTGDGGRTALMECANSSAFFVAKRLIELGANVNMIRDDGSTALHEAVFSACEDYQPPSENRMIPLLMESGASDTGNADCNYYSFVGILYCDMRTCVRFGVIGSWKCSFMVGRLEGWRQRRNWIPLAEAAKLVVLGMENLSSPLGCS